MKRGGNVAIKYYKLLDILNRRDMTREDLRLMISISSATMSKISAHEPVSLSVIDKICGALNLQPGDIMEYVPEVQENPVKSRLYWIAKYGENASMDDVFDEFNEEFPQKKGEDIFAYTQRKTSIFNEIFKSE